MSTLGSHINRTINDLHPSEARWFAVYTKYKCEKYVVDNLTKKGLEAYVPLISKTIRYVRKTKTVHLPLINCYIFVKIIKEEYVKVLESEYVMSFIKQRKDLISIPEQEINLLRRIVGEVENLETSEIDYKVGSAVEIIGGNLTGIKGTLINKKGKNSFVVKLHNIGFQLEMTIDKSLLRPLNQRLEA